MAVAKEQILVVDDEEDLRQAIVELLTADGFEVHGVASAEEAQELLSQTVFDVLITEIICRAELASTFLRRRCLDIPRSSALSSQVSAPSKLQSRQSRRALTTT